MPTQNYAIERNGPKRIQITWSGMWNDFTVKFDGTEVGKATKAEVQAGKDMTLPDGSAFRVHLRKAGMSTELALLRNGTPLPGSGADPVTLVKTAAGIVYFLAAVSTLLGIIAIAGHVEVLLNMGIGFGSIIEGGILGVLGFFTMKRSGIALILAMVLVALDGIVTIATVVGSSGTPPMGGIIMRVLFLTAMWRGFKAIGELKKQDAQAPSITSG